MKFKNLDDSPTKSTSLTKSYSYTVSTLRSSNTSFIIVEALELPIPTVAVEDIPVSEKFYKNVVSLPIYYSLKNKDLRFFTKSINNICK